MKKTIILLIALLITVTTFVYCGSNPDFISCYSTPYNSRFFVGEYVSTDHRIMLGENAEKLYLSSVQHVPIQRFGSKAELDGLKSRLNADEELFAYFDTLDKSFFEEYYLVVAFFTSPSSSYTYYVSDVFEDGGFVVGIARDLSTLNEVATDEEKKWILTLEVEKKFIDNIPALDAVMVQLQSKEY